MKPMKVTGIGIILTGSIIALYALMMLLGPSTGTVDADRQPVTPTPVVAYLLPFAIMAILIGGWMLLSHHRGAIQTRNPSIRN